MSLVAFKETAETINNWNRKTFFSLAYNDFAKWVKTKFRIKVKEK